MKNPQSSPYTHTGTNFLKILCPLCSGKIMLLFYHPHIYIDWFFFLVIMTLAFFIASIHSLLGPAWLTIHFCKVTGLFTIRTQVYWKESHFLFSVSFAGKWFSSSLAIFLPTEQPKPHTHTHKMYTHLHTYKYLYVTKSKCKFYSQTHEYSYIIH